MEPAAYDAWYETPRGAWIGESEFTLLRNVLRPQPGERLLDVGCGTGYFTRRFARDARVLAVGVDPDPSRLAFARQHGARGEHYCVGVAESLPFPNRSFDLAVAVTSLCFVGDVRRALQELLRVTRRRFAVGLLNRNSLLFRRKRRAGGSGGYRGARWHTHRELDALFDGLPVADLVFRSATFLPSGNAIDRALERIIPNRLLLGGFLVAAGNPR